MRPHPRIRAAVQWGGLGLTLLLAAVWVASAWWGCKYRFGPGTWLEGGTGLVQFVHNQDPSTDGWWNPGLRAYRFKTPQMYWRFQWSYKPVYPWSASSRVLSITVPLWSIAVATAFSSALAWRASRRAVRLRPHSCRCCAYPRAGLAAGAPCPECGAAPAGAKP